MHALLLHMLMPQNAQRALKQCRTLPKGQKLCKSQSLLCNGVCLESHFHSLLLPLNFRSVSSPADSSEVFQEPKAQHEFKPFAGYKSSGRAVPLLP